MVKAPVYLRDLNERMQQAEIEQYKKDERYDLLKAIRDGVDVVVGYYEDKPEVDS